MAVGGFVDNLGSTWGRLWMTCGEERYPRPKGQFRRVFLRNLAGDKERSTPSHLLDKFLGIVMRGPPELSRNSSRGGGFPPPLLMHSNS